MASIFKNTSTRMFCISGELSDIFCLPNGWVLNFEELLVQRLKEIGYESVVFCSSQRQMFYALDFSGAKSFDILNGKKKPSQKLPESIPQVPKTAPPKQSVSAMGFDWLADDDEDEMIVAESQPPTVESTEKGADFSYTLKAQKDEFVTAVNRFMRDTEHSKALVFTSLEDLIKLNQTDQGRQLLEYFEEWKAFPNENRNICIFLSRTLDSSGLQNMLHENRVAILESLFLRNAEFNQNASMTIGSPMHDEIENLLEILRLKGITYRNSNGDMMTAFLRYQRKDFEKLVRALGFYNRSNGFTQLKIMKEILEKFMQQKGIPEVWLTMQDIRECYPESNQHFQDEQDPMDILKHTEGWESAYHVLNSFVSNYHMLYSEVQETHQQTKTEMTVIRFETGHSSEEHRGKVPNFVLQGPPGVGKTEIAGLIGKILQKENVLKSGHTVIGSRDKLVGEYVGSTAIKTAALIEEAQEGVLLVDEVYSIAEKREGGISYCDEVFNTIVAAMTNPNYHFCVIFAGYADRMHEVWEMNEGLYSRFGASNVISLHEYQPDLLRKIFESQFGKPEGTSGQLTILSDSVKQELPVFFENYFSDRDRKNFGNARDVNNLVSEVKRCASYRHLLELENQTQPPTKEQRLTVTVEKVDFEDRQSLFQKRGYTAEDIYQKLYEYEGLEFLADMFNDQLAIRIECEEKGLPYQGPSHMIWAGNAGTGKSTAAQLTAELYHTLGIFGGTEPIYVDASEIVSSYISRSAENIRKKMDEACQKNTILVIEEAYQLLEKGGKDAIHAMLNRMETDRQKFNIILILYKDKVQEFLDENAGLASRLKVYTFPDYNAEQLFRIFQNMCTKSKDQIDETGQRAVQSLLQKMYDSGRTKNGNARIVRQLHEKMKQNRYHRIMGEMAVSLYGEDTPYQRNRVAAARAMHTVAIPENAYLFTAEDVADLQEV